MKQFANLHEFNGALPIGNGQIESMGRALAIDMVRRVQQLSLTLVKDAKLSVGNEDWAQQLLKRNAIIWNNGHPEVKCVNCEQKMNMT